VDLRDRGEPICFLLQVELRPQQNKQFVRAVEEVKVVNIATDGLQTGLEFFSKKKKIINVKIAKHEYVQAHIEIYP
jgi:hypothetical protein